MTAKETVNQLEKNYRCSGKSFQENDRPHCQCQGNQDWWQDLFQDSTPDPFEQNRAEKGTNHGARDQQADKGPVDVSQSQVDEKASNGNPDQDKHGGSYDFQRTAAQ